MVEVADKLDFAIAAALDEGLRTADIWSDGTKKVGTQEMGAAILKAFRSSAG
jgi:3-isopropylmalate dehydrogenase